MSLMGQKRRFDSRSIASGLPRSTDILGGSRHVAKVPDSDIDPVGRILIPVDLAHALARPARAIDRRFLEDRFGAIYNDDFGRRPLPTRLTTGAGDPEHALSSGRGAVLRRRVCRVPAAVRSPIADALAAAHG